MTSWTPHPLCTRSGSGTASAQRGRDLLEGPGARSYHPNRQTPPFPHDQPHHPPPRTRQVAITGGLVWSGDWYIVIAAGLTGVRASARALHAVAGMAGIGIAASPEPARGAAPRRLAWPVLGAVTIAVWPAFAARRASPRPLILSVCGSAAVTAVFVALLGWLLAETRDGSVLGLAERLTSSIQTCWPFIVAVALRRTPRPRPGPPPAGAAGGAAGAPPPAAPAPPAAARGGGAPTG